MWDYVGILRNTRRLRHAQERIVLMEKEVSSYYSRFQISKHLLEMRNLVNVAGLMVECASGRRESRGLHFNSNFPNTLDTARDTILKPDAFSQNQALPGPLDHLPKYSL